MRIETIQIQIEKNGAFKKTDHTAELTAYLQDSGEECRIQKRPAVVICPGGCLLYTSPSPQDCS